MGLAGEVAAARQGSKSRAKDGERTPSGKRQDEQHNHQQGRTRMKLYAVQIGQHETVGLVSVDATETPTGYEIEGDFVGRAWNYKRQLDKQHDARLIHLSPRAALEAFIHSQVETRDKAIRMLDAVQRLLLDAACEEQVAANTGQAVH
jgi:hypothetical protein